MAEFTKEQLISRARIMIRKHREMLAINPDYDGIARDVELFEIALAALTAGIEQEPVLIVGDDGGDALAYRRLIQTFAPGTKLYAAPQLPQPAVVPNKMDSEGEVDYLLAGYGDDFISGWNACRAAMTQGAEPVQEWIPCSERMPEKYDFDIWIFSPSEGVQHSYGLHGGSGEFSDMEMYSTINDVTHWMPMDSPAAPRQEVK